MSRCPLSISPSIPCITRLCRSAGQAATGARRGRNADPCSAGLFFARYEDLAIDAETAGSRLKNLHKRFPGRIRRLLHRLEHDVGHALDHCGLLLEREHVGGNVAVPPAVRRNWRPEAVSASAVETPAAALAAAAAVPKNSPAVQSGETLPADCRSLFGRFCP